MNSSHAAVGVSATSAVAALTTILTGFHGLNGDQAAAWAWLIVTGIGGLGMVVTKLVVWKWPSLNNSTEPTKPPAM